MTNSDKFMKWFDEKFCTSCFSCIIKLYIVLFVLYFIVSHFFGEYIKFAYNYIKNLTPY